MWQDLKTWTDAMNWAFSTHSGDEKCTVLTESWRRRGEAITKLIIQNRVGEGEMD